MDANDIENRRRGTWMRFAGSYGEFPLKTVLLVALTIIGSWIAYAVSVHWPAYRPPDTLAELLELSCKHDASKGISITRKDGDLSLATCPVIIELDQVHRASATVSSGRPFLFLSTVVCRYDVDLPEAIRVRCDSYVDAI